MDKYPLLLEGRPAGELTAVREGLYTRFTAGCPLPEGLWCAWAVGEQGELRLGVMEPQRDQGTILRRFSDRMTAPLGRILRGEVRPAGQKEPEKWTAVPAPEKLFRSPWLCLRLQGVRGAQTRTCGEVRCLALPWDPKRPFPLATLFCFAHLRPIGEDMYVVFRFDKGERPVF